MSVDLQNFAGGEMKKQIYAWLEPSANASPREKIISFSILLLIVLNTVAVILESVVSIGIRFAELFQLFETLSVAIFTVEYIFRLWSCTVDPRYSHPVFGRFRYAISPMGLIDLIAILPFYLPKLIVADLRILRILRMFTVFRLLKVGRHSQAFHVVVQAIKKRRTELFMTVALVVVMLVVSSSLMYYAERDNQPDVFSSIPESMWWGIITLSTIGYGDVTPISPAGKILGGIIALLGIGLFALPTGILASSFMQVVRTKGKPPTNCPHCGKSLED